jgi:hypothetical protein
MRPALEGRYSRLSRGRISSRTASGGLAFDPSRVPVSHWVRLRASDGSVVDSIREPDWPAIPEPSRAENSRGWRQMAMPFRAEEAVPAPVARTSTASEEDCVPGPTLFDVFEPDGTFIGALQAPPNVTLFVTRGD